MKYQLLTKEYYALQTSMEKRVSELETIVTEKSNKLETYEKLEHELDEVVIQAADGKFLSVFITLTVRTRHVSRIRPTHWRLNGDFYINQRRRR